MRAPDRLPPEARERLTQRQRRAEQARAALVRDLARRDLADLSKVPARTWDHLGPGGILALIGARRDLATLAPVSPPAKSASASPPPGGLVDRLRRRLARWLAVRPLPVVTAAAILRGGTGAVLLAVATLPGREIVTRAGWLDRPVTCRRLDRWTGGCLYIARSDGLTLERVAAALDRPIADLADANPDLPPLRPLRHGAQIVIPLHPFLKTAR